MWEANRAASQWNLQLRLHETSSPTCCAATPCCTGKCRGVAPRPIDPEAAGQSAFECIKQAFLLSDGKQLCATIVSDSFITSLLEKHKQQRQRKAPRQRQLIGQKPC